MNKYDHGWLSSFWLADDDTLARSCVRGDGSGKLAVVLDTLSDAEAEELGPQV